MQLGGGAGDGGPMPWHSCTMVNTPLSEHMLSNDSVHSGLTVRKLQFSLFYVL